ncbi:MAG: hypothetical protein JSV63_02825 [Candidatus Aenigmatarchaeota archaeon]|nr:MAG: hypothetical protein JSV63_02825 [Candidatus Aenigmarchaeota archaeon]
MVDYGKTLSGAVRFSLLPKRWLPFFILDAAFATSVLAYVLANISVFQSIFAGNATDVLVITSILGIVLIFGLGFIVWVLIKIFISGAVIHQSLKPPEFRQSWTVSKNRYLSLLVVSAIVGIISAIVGMVPYVGWVFSIIVGLMFFFALPPVIVDKMSFDRALNTAYNIFRKKTVDVFIIWLIVAIITGMIIFVFAVPAMLIVLGAMLPQLIGAPGEIGGAEFLSIVVSSGWSLFPAVLIFLVGSSIAAVFGLHAQTHFYMQLRKKGALKK